MLKRTLIIVVAFVATFGVVKYLEKNGLHLPTALSHSIHWIESLFKEEKAVSDELILNKPIEEQDNIKTHYQHSNVEKRPVCKDTSLGQLTYKKVGDVYTWTDESGTPHFSDNPPDNSDFELLNYAGEKVFDYFSLDLNTESLPYDFNQKLTIKLNKLFQLYGQLLDTSSLKKVDINIQVVTNKIAYQQIQQAHKMVKGNRSNGFYSHGSNKAYILFTNNEQTMKTAIHEATHAINRAIIGYSPKWLNEGLAGYNEGIQVSDQLARIYPHDSWTEKAMISQQMLPLDMLFSAKSKKWNGKYRQRLYATSWAFIYFMMEHPQRKSLLAKLIKIEQQNLCNVTPLNIIEDKLEVRLNILQSQFSRWSRSKLRRQSI